MKLTAHAWIIWIITLAVVLTLALLIPFAHTPAYWIALGCTVGMFVLCALMFLRSFRRDQTTESKLLGWPIFRVALVALAVQVAAGFALMGLSALCPVWAAALAEVLIFAGTFLCLTAKDAAREAITRSEAASVDATRAWKAIRAKAAALAASVGTPEMKRLSDDIRYADPMPTPLDGQISELLDILSSYATAENMSKAAALLAQRKALSKELKHNGGAA